MFHVSWFEPDLYPRCGGGSPRLKPAELTGGAGSELLLAAFAHYQARLGIDRALCLVLADRALDSGSMEHGSSFGLYYALIAMASPATSRRPRPCGPAHWLPRVAAAIC